MYKSFIILTIIFMNTSTFGSFRVGSSDICETKKLDDHAGKTACVCEVMKKGEWNEKEYPFYKKGCNKWLRRQKCDYKIVVDLEGNIDPFLSSVNNLASIKLGYVGHWGSALGTVNYTKSRVKPLVEKFNVPVLYDNTACSGASNPLLVRNYILSLEDEMQDKIIVKSNENTSVGEWSSILRPFIRSNAEITMCKQGLQIPSCKEFKNKACSIYLNEGDTIGCQNKSGKFNVYKCFDKERRTGKKLETGNWKLLDYSDLGSSMEKRRLSEIKRAVKIVVKGTSRQVSTEEYTLSSGEIVTEEYPDLYETDKYLSMPIGWFSIDDPKEKRDSFNNVFGGFTNIWTDEKDIFPQEFSMVGEFSKSAYEVLKEDRDVFIIKYNNPNLKSRYLLDSNIANYLQKNYNPIVDYYGVGFSEVEEILRLSEEI
jgi:hypothetical protein